MRELKFRAWDKLQKRMSEVDRIYVDAEEIQLRDDSGRYWRKINGVVLEQYTGLKDVNGTEIYEGDIVQYGDDIGDVFYDNDTACFNMSGFYDRHQDYPSLAFSESGNAIMKVIGNVHETNYNQIKNSLTHGCIEGKEEELKDEYHD